MKRATFILKESNIKKIKDYAYIKRLKITEVINLIVAEFFKTKK